MKIKSKNINKNAWQSWYPKKEKIDKDMPLLEEIFRKNGASKILDAGCGIGRHTIYFTEKGFKVYGFDFSPYAVKRAKERLKEKRLRADLKIWDIRRKVPYKDNFFDALLSIRVFHHNNSKTIKKIIEEFSRVVKKGGFIYIQVPPRQIMLKYAMFDERKGKNGSKIEEGTYIPDHGSEKGIPHHSFTKTELKKLFSDFKIKKIGLRDGQYNLLGVKK